jgi:hypothetical protein
MTRRVRKILWLPRESLCQGVGLYWSWGKTSLLSMLHFLCALLSCTAHLPPPSTIQTTTMSSAMPRCKLTTWAKIIRAAPPPLCLHRSPPEPSLWVRTVIGGRLHRGGGGTEAANITRAGRSPRLVWHGVSATLTLYLLTAESDSPLIFAANLFEIENIKCWRVTYTTVSFSGASGKATKMCIWLHC